MKILLVQDHLRSGGTERQTVLLANAFAAAGDETSLITFRPGGILQAGLGGSVHHQALQPFDLGLDWFAPGLSSAIRRRAPDIVLCMGRMANCYAGGIRRRSRTAAGRPQVLATLRTGKSLPTWFRRSLGQVDHVVTNSREALVFARDRLGVPAGRLTPIHNALVFPEERPADEIVAVRTAHGAGPRTVVLLCVAMFRREKNQRELIEIVAGLPPALDWQLWLAGDGPHRTACERLAQSRGLAGRVKFPGWLRDPSALYGAADLAVHASWSESLSNFLIEAQARGLPAVAYEARGIRECFLPDDTGFAIPWGDRQAFRSTLERLAQSQPGEIQARATRARRHARQQFDPTRQIAAYRELFGRLLTST